MSVIKKYRFTHVVILLVCGIGIGFTLRSMNRGTATGVHYSDAKPITHLAGTMEEQFAAALQHIGDEKQRLASRAVFSKLELDELTPLAARVEKFTEEHSEKTGDNGGWILCNEFYLRWGVLAPLEALKFLKTHESNWSGPNASVWKAWAQTDPDAAIAAYNPKLEDQYSSELQDGILDGLCSVNPVKALHFADAQEIGSDSNFRPENHDEIYEPHAAIWELLEYVPVERPYDSFGLALYSWMRRDPVGALKEILTLKYDYLQVVSLNALFSNWFMQDPDAAQLALKKITPRGLRESTTHTAMQAYLSRHPRKAFERIIELPQYVAYAHFDGSPINTDPFAESDCSEESETIEVGEEDSTYPLPDRFCHTDHGASHDRLELISEAAASLGILEGKAAWDRAIIIQDKNNRAAALGGALAGWLIFDLEEASSFAATGIANGSFIAPGGHEFPDFAARLVSKDLAKYDFQHAIAWVGSLPDGPLREVGIDNAADTFLDKVWHTALYDKSGYPHFFQEAQIRGYTPVMEWLTSLPPSKGRDLATSSLVFRLRDHDDPTSALKWAATINDKRLRRLRFESLAKEIFSPKQGQYDAVDFDFATWASAHPELATEMKQGLLRKKMENKGGRDEK